MHELPQNARSSQHTTAELMGFRKFSLNAGSSCGASRLLFFAHGPKFSGWLKWILRKHAISANRVDIKLA
jgi:hypothetical protein